MISRFVTWSSNTSSCFGCLLTVPVALSDDSIVSESAVLKTGDSSDLSNTTPWVVPVPSLS